MADPITFRNVAAPDFRAGNDLLQSANQQINQAVQSGVAQLQGLAREQEEDATAGAINQINQLDVAGVDEALQSGQFENVRFADTNRVLAALQGRRAAAVDEANAAFTQAQNERTQEETLLAQGEEEAVTNVNALVQSKDYVSAQKALDAATHLRPATRLALQRPIDQLKTSKDVDALSLLAHEAETRGSAGLELMRDTVSRFSALEGVSAQDKISFRNRLDQMEDTQRTQQAGTYFADREAAAAAGGEPFDPNNLVQARKDFLAQHKGTREEARLDWEHAKSVYNQSFELSSSGQARVEAGVQEFTMREQERIDALQLQYDLASRENPLAPRETAEAEIAAKTAVLEKAYSNSTDDDIAIKSRISQIFNKGITLDNKKQVPGDQISAAAMSYAISVGATKGDGIFFGGDPEVIVKAMETALKEILQNPGSATLDRKTRDKLFRELEESKLALRRDAPKLRNKLVTQAKSQEGKRTRSTPDISAIIDDLRSTKKTGNTTETPPSGTGAGPSGDTPPPTPDPGASLARDFIKNLGLKDFASTSPSGLTLGGAPKVSGDLINRLQEQTGQSFTREQRAQLRSSFDPLIRAQEKALRDKAQADREAQIQSTQDFVDRLTR